MHYLSKFVLILGLVTLSASAKEPEGKADSPTGKTVAPSAEQIQAIEKVSHWIGDWSGTGWSMSPDRQRHDFEVFEQVSSCLDGSVLLVEGKGVMETDGGVRKTTHESLAILSFDVDAKQYKWRTYDLSGSVRDPDFSVEQDSFKWSFRDEESGVLLRFTIKVQGDNWHEIGEVSPDKGENWYQILEMNLVRQ